MTKDTVRELRIAGATIRFDDKLRVVIDTPDKNQGDFLRLEIRDALIKNGYFATRWSYEPSNPENGDTETIWKFRKIGYAIGESPEPVGKELTPEAIEKAIMAIGKLYPDADALYREMDREMPMSPVKSAFQGDKIVIPRRAPQKAFRRYNFNDCDNSDKAIREIIGKVERLGLYVVYQRTDDLFTGGAMKNYFIYANRQSYQQEDTPLANFLYDANFGSSQNMGLVDNRIGSKSLIKLSSGTSRNAAFFEQTVEQTAMAHHGTAYSEINR